MQTKKQSGRLAKRLSLIIRWETMAYTCAKCGWKHKVSQRKYYQSRGLTRPICEDCNPSMSQKVKRAHKAFLVDAFSTFYMGYGPLASIPYVPIIMLLSVLVAYVSSQKIQLLTSFVFFLVGYVANLHIATEVGDKIRRRLIEGRSVRTILVVYYSPLAAFICGSILFCWFKFA